MLENITAAEIGSSFFMLVGAFFMLYILHISKKFEDDKNKQHQKHKKITNNCY